MWNSNATKISGLRPFTIDYNTCLTAFKTLNYAKRNYHRAIVDRPIGWSGLSEDEIEGLRAEGPLYSSPMASS